MRAQLTASDLLALIIFSTSRASLTSAGCTNASPPAERTCSAVCSSLAGVRPTATTDAPPRAKARQTARPIPVPAPVTTTT